MPAPRPNMTWSLESLRLPKTIEAEETGPALHASLRARTRKLWAGGELPVPSAPWSPSLVTALGHAQRAGRLVRGLEQAEKVLEREAHGMSLVDARTTTERGSRVSRLLLVGNDGTERFYRQVERLVTLQGPRLLVIWVDVDSDQLASVVPEAAGVVRAVMVEHKDHVSQVLLALYARAAGG
jgi:hypothetical protein